MTTLKERAEALESMSNEDLGIFAFIVRMEIRQRINALSEMHKVPEEAAAQRIAEKKEWFKNICGNKHENYRVICKSLLGDPSSIVKQCHDCGATAQLGSDEWTRKAGSGLDGRN